MRAIAGVDDRDVEMAGDESRRARGGVAHDQAVGLHSVQILDRVEEGFAFFQAGSFGLEIHGVGTEAGRGGGEADARAGRVFEKGEGHRFATEGGQLF